MEWIRFKRPSMVGIVTGAVAGLATVTPASGFVGPMGGLILGVAGSFICFNAVDFIKHRLKIDDSLDVFAVHGVGGILGSLLVAFLAMPSLGGIGYAEGMSAMSQLGVQALGVIITVAWSALASFGLVAALKPFMALRPHEEDVEEGLDISIHGERGYTLADRR